MAEQRAGEPARARRVVVGWIAGALAAPVLPLPAPAQPADGALRAIEVDVNLGRRADLERLPGIGVDLAEAMLRERERRPYADWVDLIARVPGLGPRRATRLSRAGLRVRGLPYAPPATTGD